MPESFPGTGKAEVPDIQNTRLILGFLQEAMLACSNQDGMESFWRCACERSRWIIPARRMCVFVRGDESGCEVPVRYETGVFSPPIKTHPTNEPNLAARTMEGSAARWFSRPWDAARRPDELHRWLFKDEPGAILAVPLQEKERPVGGVLFVFAEPPDASSRSILASLATLYVTQVGMTYALLKKMQELSSTNQKLNAEIEQRTRAQTELARLASFPENNPNPVIEVTPDFGFRYSNDAARAQLPDLQERRSDHPVLIGIKQLAAAAKDSAGQCIVDEVEVGASTFQRHVVLHQDIIRVYLQNLTDRKKLEESVRQFEKMSAVGQLAAGVAHEINNPLGVILGFAQSMARRIPGDHPLSLPVKSIEREALRCKNLVQDLLAFSRQSKARMEEFDLNEAVRSTLSIVEAQARVKSVEISKELGDAKRVLGDKNQIQQVIVNLCNNAIDAIAKGGKIVVRTRGEGADGRSIALEVEDNGSGIPEEIKDKIFDPFFTTKEVGKGTGLGLSLVYEIVQRHKGTIKFRSEAGRGTTFTILLPVKA